MTERYTWEQRVLAVEDRRRVVSTHKEEDGSITNITEPTGWWIVTEDNIAHGLGAEKPNILKGDTVKMTMEKV